MALELCTNFAGTLFGLTNFLAMTAGFVCPSLIGMILDNGGDVLGNWSVVYYLSAAFSAVGTIFFLLFGSAERQTWDLVDSRSAASVATCKD